MNHRSPLFPTFQLRIQIFSTPANCINSEIILLQSILFIAFISLFEHSINFRLWPLTLTLLSQHTTFTIQHRLTNTPTAPLGRGSNQYLAGGVYSGWRAPQSEPLPIVWVDGVPLSKYKRLYRHDVT